MIIENRLFYLPENENVKIWRYMNFTKFISLIENKSLFFSRADKLGDPYEGSISMATNKRYYDYLSPSFTREQADKIWINSSDFRKQAVKFTFVNCWHMNAFESDAMWKLYISNTEGIAIQTTVKKLKKIFESESNYGICIGEVFYSDFENDIHHFGNSLYPYIYKRKCFEHEKEFRAVIQILDAEKQKSLDIENLNGISIPIEFDELIESVYISPTSNKWFYELVTSLLDRYKLNFKPIFSALNEPAFF